jgi:hypothetical protein
MNACDAAAFKVVLQHTDAIWFGVVFAADLTFGLIASVR